LAIVRKRRVHLRLRTAGKGGDAVTVKFNIRVARLEGNPVALAPGKVLSTWR